MTVKAIIGLLTFLCAFAGVQCCNNGGSQDPIVDVIEDLIPSLPDPRISMTTPQVIKYWGYKCEINTVTTDDGYIIDLHRIQCGKNNSNCTGFRQPILLMHGFLSDSFTWLVNQPNDSFPFLLAEDGYDVWVGNFRGNKYGQKHVKLSPFLRAFWHFSWDEMARYDLAAFIDYIINKTGSKCIFYVGHSMGTTAMFALLSNRTEYNDKVGVFIALAPVVYLSPSTFLQSLEALAATTLKLLGKAFIEKIDLTPDGIKVPEALLCSALGQGRICGFTSILSGGGFSLQNQNQAEVNNAHFPEPTSYGTVIHYVQAGRDNTTFLFYNYCGKNNLQIYSPDGLDNTTYLKNNYCEKENLEKYGQTTPLSYDLANIKTPVALLYGLGDTTATPGNVANLYPKLTSCFYYEPVNYTNFGHGDFVNSISAAELVYYPMIELLKGFLVGAKCKK